MPNWSQVSYRIRGKKKHLRNLNSILNKLGKRKTPLVKNGFGKYWLGCLVTALGGDWNEIPCRGEINHYYLDTDHLEISFEVAWSERREFRDFIESHYNNEIKIFYSQEEPGMGIYETNSYEEFNTRYIIDGEEEPFPEYYSDLEEVSRVLSDYIGEDIEPNIESIEEAVSDFEIDTTKWLSFHEFSLVD